jgi:hypothetical protein
MVRISKMRPGNRWVLLFFLANSLFLSNHFQAFAQEMPPRPISLSLLQNLNFGAFYQGPAGGTVTIHPSGSRIATGDIVLVNLGYSYFSAIFLLEGNPGAIVHILAGPNVQLNGSNGGFLTLEVGNSDPGDPIIINVAPPGQMQIRVGGTIFLQTPLANPVGTYSGLFSVMFIQE